MQFIVSALVLLLLAAPAVGDEPLDPGDPKSKARILKEALSSELLELRGPERLYYQRDSLEPFTGWSKAVSQGGQPLALGHFNRGRMDGRYLQWDEDGQKLQEGSYRNGNLDGLITKWHGNGQKKEESRYSNGKFDGLSTHWYESGGKSQEIVYKDGLMEGLATSWHANGQKSVEGQFRRGKQEGVEVRWNEQGRKVQETHYREGKFDGVLAQWHANGQRSAEAFYKEGKKEGPYRQWHENGQLAEEGANKNGVADGPLTKWDKDGNPTKETRFKAGWEVREGDPDLGDPKVFDEIVASALAWESLESNEEGIYSAPNEKKAFTGWIKKVHGNGRVALLGPLREGIPLGLWTWWDENGVKQETKRYEWK